MILAFWKMIEQEVFRNFSFLQHEYGFPPFEMSAWRDEYYIRSRKGDIEFSVYIQMESDACPSISIINHLEKAELDDTLSPTHHYDIETLEPESAVISSMPARGEVAIRQYIAECAHILKRHPDVLAGDTTAFTKKQPFKELTIEVYHRGKDGIPVRDGFRKIKSLDEISDLQVRRNFFQRLVAAIRKFF